MNLYEVLTDLAQAELSNLAVTNDSGEISPSSVKKITSYVNEALLRLHSRFVLREDDLLIQMFEEVTTYEFKPQFAVSYTGPIEVVHRYIIDDNPDLRFKDDVIRVLRVFDSYGCELELNNDQACFSLFTPRPKTIQIPCPMPGQGLSIIYQARHRVLISGTQTILEEQEVEVPDILFGAMKAYVGYIAFNSIGGQDNIIRANGFLNIYEKICGEVEDKDSMGTATRTWSYIFERRGFV